MTPEEVVQSIRDSYGERCTRRVHVKVDEETGEKTIKETNHVISHRVNALGECECGMFDGYR